MSIPLDAFGWLAWFVAAYVVSAFVTQRLVGWASSRGVIDRPNARSSHTRVTPRGGGIAIVGVTAWAAVAACVLEPGAWKALAAVLVPAMVIAAVSWVDDVSSLPNRVRFGVHLAAAAAVALVLGPISQVVALPLVSLDLGFFAWPLTLLWIVGMTNAFNFMDGIDGIAGITAAVAGAAMAAAAMLLGATAVAAVAIAFSGAAAGFLVCNWPPARIFMGDVGSAFCGFVIASLPIAAGEPAASQLAAVVAVTMWPFIFDTAFTLCRRLARGENIFQAHRSHLYQRLVIAGWSHRAVSSFYGGLSAMAAAIAVSGLAREDLARSSGAVVAATIVVGSGLLLSLVWAAERPLAGQHEGRA